MAAYRQVYDTHQCITCRLTARNRDQLRNRTLGNRVCATFYCAVMVHTGSSDGDIIFPGPLKEYGIRDGDMLLLQRVQGERGQPTAGRQLSPSVPSQSSSGYCHRLIFVLIIKHIL